MPLESGTTIAELDASWPTGTDDLNQGDDHIRLIKSILQAQFPGALGEGFAIAIVATEEELNYLQGATSNIQDQIDAINAGAGDLVAPQGTAMLFYQATPPTGWTQDVAEDNRMLRLVSSATGGTLGGTDSPISFSFSHVHATSDHTLTLSQLPDLSSALQIRFDASGQADNHVNTDRVARGRPDGGTWHSEGIRSQGLSSQPHNHGNTQSAGDNFEPRYANVIVAVKD